MLSSELTWLSVAVRDGGVKPDDAARRIEDFARKVQELEGAARRAIKALEGAGRAAIATELKRLVA